MLIDFNNLKAINEPGLEIGLLKKIGERFLFHGALTMQGPYPDPGEVGYQQHFIVKCTGAKYCTVVHTYN